MSVFVLVCGNVFDGISDSLVGSAEILVEGNRIARIERSVGRPPDAQVIDLSERTVSPGFIDTHVHLTMDAANLAVQTLQSSAAKALKGLSLAREYMSYGFTTLRDLSAASIRNGRQSICATRSIPVSSKDRGFSLPRISSARAPVTATFAAFMPRGGPCRSRRSPTIPGASERWCGASTPSAATGSRPPILAAISVPATIQRG